MKRVRFSFEPDKLKLVFCVLSFVLGVAIIIGCGLALSSTVDLQQVEGTFVSYRKEPASMRTYTWYVTIDILGRGQVEYRMARYIAENFSKDEFLSNVHQGDLLFLTIGDDSIYAVRDAEKWYLKADRSDKAMEGNQIAGIVVGSIFILVSLAGCSTMFKIKRLKPRRRRK